jgi:hypothetical protein
VLVFGVVDLHLELVFPKSEEFKLILGIKLHRLRSLDWSYNRSLLGNSNVIVFLLKVLRGIELCLLLPATLRFRRLDFYHLRRSRNHFGFAFDEISLLIQFWEEAMVKPREVDLDMVIEDLFQVVLKLLLMLH